MIENIDLTKAPHSCGVYFFKDVNEEIIYIGSSKDLYQRIKHHRVLIRKGINSKRNKELYQFLQSNEFTVEYQLEENYRQLEQVFIEKYNPKYNAVRAYTGITSNGNETEYALKHYYKFHEEHLKRNRQYKKYYCNQLCSYNGETLTLNALTGRFLRRGIPHPTLEAKKYLIPTAY